MSLENLSDDELMSLLRNRERLEEQADAVFPALIEQESGGRPGVLGPPTRYGRAVGMTQMLPDTAKEMADRIGVEWRPDLLSGTSQEAADYQRRLGREYLIQGLEETGNTEDALRYYHGGPNRKLWGPKTENYVSMIAQRQGRDAPESQPDISSLSDEELMALLGEGGNETAGQSAPPPETPRLPMTTTGGTAARPGVGYIDANTAEPLNESQASTYADLVGSGELDRNARPGSRAFPLAQRDAMDLPKPGDWYVDVAGKLDQVPEIPMLATAANLGALALGGPMSMIDLAAGLTPMKRGPVPSLESLIPDDPRTDAIKRGALSGLLFGGRNELVAGLEAIPGLAEGSEGLTRAFDKALRREDAASAQARRDFPVAYDTSAVGSALLSGAVLPAGGASLGGRVATGAGIGGAGGFLATDGTTEDRLMGAGLGAALGGALPMIPMLRNAPRRVTDRDFAEADAALERLGVSRDALPEEAVSTLQREMRRGAEPADAAIMALNESLPTPIPLKRGDITGLPGDQFEFSTALRGARGEDAAVRARQLAEQQQEAIRAVTEQLASGLSGGQIPMRGRGGLAAAEALAAQRAAAKRGVDEAYSRAREMGDSAMLPSASGLRQAMLDGLQDFDLQDIDKVARVVDSFGEAGAPTARQIFDARARLSRLRQAGGLDSAAASDAISALDGYVNDAMTNDLIVGDPAAVQQWRDAIAANREYASIFKSGDLVDKLTRTSGANRELAVDPGDAANLIFGRSALGMVGQKNLYRDLSKMRDLLGADSEGWNQLRAEAFMRFAQAAETTTEGGVPQFSGLAFQKAWEKALREDRRLIETLFSESERDTIGRFAAMSSRVTNPVRGGDNPSNSANALKMLRQLGGATFAVGRVIPFLNVSLVELEKMVAAQGARRALRPIPRRRGIPMRQVPGRAGGYLGSAGVEPSEPATPTAPGG